MQHHQLQPVLEDLTNRLRALFPGHIKEIILFGSFARNEFARNEAEAGSDIDVLVLVDLSREVIAQYIWKLGDLASELLLKYDIMVSPLIENQNYYERFVDIIPLFRNVRKEGIAIGA